MKPLTYGELINVMLNGLKGDNGTPEKPRIIYEDLGKLAVVHFDIPLEGARVGFRVIGFNKIDGIVTYNPTCTRKVGQ